jgi:hypothetical protein
MSDIGAQATSLMETRDAASQPTEGDPAEGSTIRSVAKDGQPPQSEQNLVKEILKKIDEWNKHHEKVFDKMKEDVRFAANKNGAQWYGTKASPSTEEYVANITFRHIQGRTGVLYAKNPRVKAKRRKRIDYKVWDGTKQQLQQAMQAMEVASKAASGQPSVQPGPDGKPMVTPPPPMPNPVDIQGAQAVLQEAQQVKAKRAMLDRIGKTAEILYQYYQGEGDPAFKKRAKAWVRRTLTCGVGWLKLDFERVRGPGEQQYRPEDKDNVDNLTSQLAHLQSELEKVADDETPDNSPRLVEIEAQLKALQEAAYIVVKEGLTFSFPKSWHVIPDDNCSQLSGLVGCWEIAEAMPMTPDEIREAYKVDVGKNFKHYSGKDKIGRDRIEAMTYEHYNRRTGLMCVVCEGYPGFLVAPTPPRVAIPRFFPYYPLAFNEMEGEDGEIFPPSDVELIKHQQREYNRSREALRQHRIASQPGHIANKSAFSNEEDVKKMKDRVPHEVTMLEGIGDKDIKTVIMAVPLNTIDPNVYEVNQTFQDIQRTVGEAAANLGGTSKDATATEASIGENSRLSTVESNKDDLDMVLTEVARDSAHVMLTQVSQETATKIAGEGAIWPAMTGENYSMEIYLEIVAGSSGRPNRDRDAANIERLFPLAIQTGEIRPGYLAEKVVETMDETVDLEDAILEGMPSILALNAMAKGGGAMMGAPGGGDAPPPSGNPASDPTQQGGAPPAPQQSGGGPGTSFPAPDASRSGLP